MEMVHFQESYGFSFVVLFLNVGRYNIKYAVIN